MKQVSGFSWISALVLAGSWSVATAATPPVKPGKPAAPAAAKSTKATTTAVTSTAAAVTPLPENVMQERRKLEAEIQARLETLSDREINPRRVAEDLKIEWPIKAPELSLAEARKAAEAAVQAELDKQFPATKIDEIRKAVETQFALVKDGESVSFDLIGGRGKASGLFEGVSQTQKKARIGGIWVSLRDLDEGAVVRLDPDLNQKFIQKQIGRDLRKLDLDKESFVEANRAAIEEKSLNASEYVKIAGVGRGARAAAPTWISRKDLVDAEVLKRRKVAMGKVRPAVEEEVFTNAGYVKFDGQWMPKSLAETRKAEKTAAAEKAKEEQDILDLQKQVDEKK